MRSFGLVGLATLIGFAGVYALATPPEPDCVIKGNISINSGERIYHVPGQHWYEDTGISPDYGERWFCSEADAGVPLSEVHSCG